MHKPEIMGRDDFAQSEDERELKSKSQLKREAETLQTLGRNLVELPAARYAALMAKLELPDTLREALDGCRAINARGGRKRQLQFIGKLMRRIDAEPVRRALEDLAGKDSARTAALHRLEMWRGRLITEGDAALAELLNEYPMANRQQLRQLVMKARKERDTGQPPAAARSLFRILRGLMEDALNTGGEE